MNTTIGQIDTGQHCADIEGSRQLIARGYQTLEDLVQQGSEADWLKPVDTPFSARCPEYGFLPTRCITPHIMPGKSRLGWQREADGQGHAGQ